MWLREPHAQNVILYLSSHSQGSLVQRITGHLFRCDGPVARVSCAACLVEKGGGQVGRITTKGREKCGKQPRSVSYDAT